MAASEQVTFACDTCGRSYRWQPQLAGRSARCKCGKLLRVPQNPPQQNSDLYDLAQPHDPAERAASSASPAIPQAPSSASVPRQRPPAALAAGMASDIPAATRPLEYVSPGAHREADEYVPDPLKDLHLPLVLLVGGIVVQFVMAWLGGSRTASGAAASMTAVGIDLVFGTTFLLVGALIAGRMRGIDFGRFPIALLKLSAIAVAPGAVSMLLGLVTRFIPFGGLLNWIATFILYFALIGALFDLDESDTWFLVITVFLLRVAAAVVIFFVFVSSL